MVVSKVCSIRVVYWRFCPESLDPKGATVIEKRILREENLKWEGLPVSPHPMMDFRNVPTKKLMQRLDVLMFLDEGPMADIVFDPETVRITLNQHIGAPAKPLVNKGSNVKKFDLIAEGNGKISSNIHASIDGKVIDVNDWEIIIQRNK